VIKGFPSSSVAICTVTMFECSSTEIFIFQSSNGPQNVFVEYSAVYSSSVGKLPSSLG
jgi:cold shock CspA family protein